MGGLSARLPSEVVATHNYENFCPPTVHTKSHRSVARTPNRAGDILTRRRLPSSLVIVKNNNLSDRFWSVGPALRSTKFNCISFLLLSLAHRYYAKWRCENRSQPLIRMLSIGSSLGHKSMNLVILSPGPKGVMETDRK